MICDPLKICRKEGLDPQTLKIIMQRPDHLVAKVETAAGPVVFKANSEALHTSWDGINIKRLAAAGLPMQTVIAQGEAPVSYVILSWLEGEPLTDRSPLAAQIEAGRLLHRIHHLDNRPLYEKEYGWDEWMKGWLDVVLPWWGRQAGVTGAAVETAWRSFETVRPLLVNRGHHFMLQDGRPDHFLVQGERIVGLIDVHDGQAGDGGMDLGVIGVLDEPLLANMRLGYEADQEETAVLDRLIPFYIFLRRLAAAEWHGKNGSAAIAKQALALANQHPLDLRNE